MSIRKRGKIYWYDFSFRKKRYRGSCFTEIKEIAKEFEFKIKTEIYNQEFLGKTKQITWIQAINLYINGKNNVSDSAKDILSVIFKKLKKLNYLNKVVEKEDINYLKKMLIQSNKNATTQTYLRMLGAVWNYCHRNGKIQDKIIIDTSDLFTEGKKTFLTKEEWNKLISVVDNEIDKNILIVLLNTGCRINELLQLTRDRVNLDKEYPYIFIPKSLTKEKKDKYIPLFKPSVNAITELLNSNPNANFINMRYAIFLEKVKEYCKLANIKEITPHTFRHTFLTWASTGELDFLNGKPMDNRFRKKMVGHSINSNVTENYTHDDYKDIIKSIK